eukprot:15345369-Ditylum_brightwellii.AAC.1
MQELDLERKQLQEQYKEELETGKAMFCLTAKDDNLYNGKEVHVPGNSAAGGSNDNHQRFFIKEAMNKIKDH